MVRRLAAMVPLLFALAACSGNPYSRSTGGVSALDKTLLYDFRTTSTLPLPNNDPTVLSALFPSYLTDRRRCEAGAAQGHDIERGQIVPQIRGEVSGSFTSPGVKQTAYLVDVGECSSNPTLTTRRLVVFTGSTIAANVDTLGANAILATYDLAQDGASELLLAGGIARQGVVAQSAKLSRFEKGSLKTIEDFGEAYNDACNAQPAGPIDVLVVYYLPTGQGNMPKFTAERYRSECPQPGQKPSWVRVGASQK